jgi:hypothetical protein
MSVARSSISLTRELDEALGIIVARTGQPKSKVIEILLRENAVVQHAIESMRLEFFTEPVAVPGKRPRAKVNERDLKQRA